MYFGHKHVETGLNYLHELDILFRYHMLGKLENFIDFKFLNVFVQNT